MNAPKECFHNHTNVFIRVDGTQQLNGPQNLTVILQDACCVQAQQYLGQCEKKTKKKQASGLLLQNASMVTQMASVNLQWSLEHGEVMSPWVLPVTLYDPWCVQAPMFLEQWEMKQASQLLQQNASMVTQISFMNLQVLSVNRAVMDSWVLPVTVQDPCCVQAPMFPEQWEMISGLRTTPIEFFQSHTNFFHELIRVGGKKNSKGSVGPITITLQDLCCVQAQQFLGQ